MLNLIINEWQKSFFRKKNYTSLLILVIISLFISLTPLLGSQDSNKSYGGDDWERKVNESIKDFSEENKTLNEESENSNPEELTLESSLKYIFNEAEIKRLEYHLNSNIQPPSINNFYDHITAISNINIIIATFVIIMASGIVSDEFASGTIKMLVTRSYTRSQILFSKFATVIGISLVYYFLVLITIATVSLFTTEMNPTGLYVYLDSNSLYSSTPFISYFMKLLASNVFYIVIIATIIFFLSTITLNTTATLGFGLGIIYIGPAIMSYISKKTSLIKYFIIPNWNLSNYLPGGNGSLSLKGLTANFSIAICLVYLIVMVYVSFKLFKSRDITS